MRYENVKIERGPNLCKGKGVHLNPDDARYCEICGSRTVYFEKGLLKPYQVEQHEYANARQSIMVWEFNGLKR